MSHMMDNEFTPLLANAYQDSHAMIIATFSYAGELCYANCGMKQLLQHLKPNQVASDFLVNPSLAKILTLSQDFCRFKGLLTLGNHLDFNISVLARIYVNKQRILILAEHHIEELLQVNHTILTLNNEIQSLQRDLIKEKNVLEQTLKQLKDTQVMLIHSEKMNALGQMVAGVAHEINTPIAFTMNNMSLLKEAIGDIHHAYQELEQLNQNETEQLKNIREKYDLDFQFADLPDLLKGTTKGLETVRRIVLNLRDFSRLDEAHQKMVNLQTCLQETLSLAKPTLLEKQINCQVNNQTIPEFLGYPAELNQAFLNLIINAVQAMSLHGNLTISLAHNEHYAFIAFKDDGVGIANDVKVHIFEPFFTTKPVGNTGLGLSISHNIITKMHKGDIEVDSILGQGSTFTVKLPLHT